MQGEAQFTLTPEDLLEFRQKQATLLSKFPGATKRPSLTKWVFVLGAAILIFFIMHKQAPPTAGPPPAVPPQNSWGMSPFLYVIIFLCVFVYFLYQARYAKGPVRKLFADSHDLAQTQRIQFSDEGITFENPTSSSHLKWSHFACFAESQSLFYLFNSSRHAHIIPKRAFASPEDRSVFENLARASVADGLKAFPVTINPIQPPPIQE